MLTLVMGSLIECLNQRILKQATVQATCSTLLMTMLRLQSMNKALIKKGRRKDEYRRRDESDNK